MSNYAFALQRTNMLQELNNTVKSLNNKVTIMEQTSAIKHINIDDNNITYVLLPYLIQKHDGYKISYSNNTENSIDVFSNIKMYNRFYSPNGTDRIVLKPNNFMLCVFNYNKFPVWNVNIS